MKISIHVYISCIQDLRADTESSKIMIKSLLHITRSNAHFFSSQAVTDNSRLASSTEEVLKNSIHLLAEANRWF